jgi:uncharacterized protein (TIGR03382 family)
MTCSTGSSGSCPSGFTCEATSGANGACWPTKDLGGGCCDASGASAGTSLLGFAVVGLVLRARRRRAVA